jgi:hypothetical protein
MRCVAWVNRGHLPAPVTVMKSPPTPEVNRPRAQWLGLSAVLAVAAVALSGVAALAGLQLWQQYQSGYVHGLWGLLTLRFGSVAVVLLGLGACGLAARWFWHSGSLAWLTVADGQPTICIHGLRKVTYHPMPRKKPVQLLGQVYAWRLRHAATGQVQTRWVLLTDADAKRIGRWVTQA